MKIIKKSFAILLIGLLSISNIFATGIPDEPMIIYGNIYGIEGKILKIYDGNNSLLKEININFGKYGTKKTFDNKHKIILNTFSGELKFEIDGKSITAIKDKGSNCSNTVIFQKGNICKYDLDLYQGGDSYNPELGDLFIGNIESDNLIIEDKYKTNNLDDVFKGKFLEKNKKDITDNVLKNILNGVDENEKVIVTANRLEVAKKNKKKIVLINETKKEAIFIPEETEIVEKDVIIEKPKKIENITVIKSKINKNIVAAVEVPTNKQVNFKKDIKICTTINISNTKNLKVYSSHDNINWILDNKVKNLEISNGQACFDVNHLTSFAVGGDENNSNTNSSSHHSSGGHSKTKNKTYNLNDNSKNKIAKIDDNKTKKEEIEIDNKTPSELTEKEIKEINKKIKTENKDFKKEIVNKKDENIKFIKSDLKVKSTDYIKTVKQFKKEKELITNVSGYKVIKIIGDPDYNKQIDLYVIQIFNDIKNKDIRESMFSHLNKMTKTYGIYTNENLDTNLIETYKKLLAIHENNFKFKLKKLKFKDYIVNKTITERLLKKARENPVKK